jgi:DNA-directed RNA polymerase subunit H (RpoH/RPB5)
MFQRQFIYGTTYAAIEYAEKNQFNILQLNKKKNSLELEKKAEIKDFSEISTILKGQKHLFLIVNNEQVLTKKIEKAIVNEEELVRTAFPSIKLSDFYYQTYQQESCSFVAVIRKKVINELITQFDNLKISIIDFSIGNLVVHQLLNFTEILSVTTSNASISITENKKIDNILKQNGANSVSYNINDLIVTNQHILSLAGIIDYYTNSTSSKIKEDLLSRFKQKQFFSLGIKVGLSFLLTVLLINFIVFSNYRDRFNVINGELEMSKTFKNQLNVLQKQVGQKKQLVESVFASSNSLLSMYVDEIGASLPATSLLSQIYYQPLNGVLKDNKPILYSENTIVIKGRAKNNDDFSEWISILEKKNWIKDVNIIFFGKGSKSINSASFEFEIIL